jgi:uncharacterized coiled-coil DUF342 family protein
MATQTTPTLSTVERLLDEVGEWSNRLKKVRQKLGRLRRGSEAYPELLPDLEVALDVLRSKAQHAHKALEEFEESLTDTE